MNKYIVSSSGSHRKCETALAVIFILKNHVRRRTQKKERKMIMWIESTPNGKYKFREQYTDPLTGKNKTVSVTLDKNTATTRRLALEELTKKINQKKGCLENIDSLTLSDLVAKYEKYQRSTLKPSTYRRNHFACVTIRNILGSDVLVNRLTAQYVKEKFLDSGKAPSTLNELRIRFSALIRWGYQNDYIRDVSFLDKFKPFPDIPHRNKIQDKYLESDELRTLLSAMGSCWHWKYLTEFLALSGLRFGEAAALISSDIDFDESVIHVTKTYDHNNNVTTSTKTQCSCRDVYIQPELERLLRKISLYMKIQRVENGYANDEDLFFCMPNGKHINHAAYEKYIRETSQKALGRRITPHTLRHTHASLLLENGVDIYTISRRLGHENSKVTREIYLHVTEKLQEKDNEQIRKIKII